MFVIMSEKEKNKTAPNNQHYTINQSIYGVDTHNYVQMILLNDDLFGETYKSRIQSSGCEEVVLVWSRDQNIQ